MRNKIAIGLVSFALISSCANLLDAIPKTVELDLKAVKKIELPGIPEWLFNFCDHLN
jgi:hypothetical protein